MEAAAGDGFLSACLRRLRPRLRVEACDDGSWERPVARMSPAEKRRYAKLPVPALRLGAGVERSEAVRAVRRGRPDLVLVSWAPPGRLVERLIRTPCKYVLDIGADGDQCGAGPRTWRLAAELLDGPLEKLALCRLDERPRQTRHSRLTLYHGAAFGG